MVRMVLSVARNWVEYVLAGVDEKRFARRPRHGERIEVRLREHLFLRLEDADHEGGDRRGPLRGAGRKRGDGRDVGGFALGGKPVGRQDDDDPVVRSRGGEIFACVKAPDSAAEGGVTPSGTCAVSDATIGGAADGRAVTSTAGVAYAEGSQRSRATHRPTREHGSVVCGSAVAVGRGGTAVMPLGRSCRRRAECRVRRCSRRSCCRARRPWCSRTS